MSEIQTPQHSRYNRGFSIGFAIGFAVMVMYFGAPIILVAPFIRSTGDVPDWIDKAYIPITWLDTNVPIYHRYMLWQRDLILK